MNRNGALLHNWRLLSSLLVLILAGSAAASLCVWRQPDADIAGIFGSGTYKTIFVDITDSMAQKIEKRLGYALDPDETQFKFFPVFRKGKQIGTVMTHAGKGQYGAIEVVVAVVETDSGAVVKHVRIQRDREKAKAALRSEAFLGQFKGMSADDDFGVRVPGSGTRAKGIKPAQKGAEKASQAVASAVRKLLIAYEELNPENRQGRQERQGSENGQ